MKNEFTRILTAASLCAMMATALAQTSSDNSSSPGSSYSSGSTNQTSSTRDTRQSRQFWHSRELVGTNVKDSQGQKLGEVQDILFNAKTGETFAAIDIGHSSYALVPAQALNVTPSTSLLSRKPDINLAVTKDSLQNGPTISNNEWQKLDNTEFTQSIYSHYNLQPPSAMGGVGSGSMGGSSVGRSIMTNLFNQPK